MTRIPSLENCEAAKTALELVAVNVQDDQLDDAAMVLAEMVEVKRLAARVYDDVEKHLLSLMTDKRVEVPGVGLVEAKRKITRRGWQHDDLFRAVIARIADEPGVFFDEDGCMMPSAQVAANLVSRLRDVLSPSWKVTGLRAVGMDADEFCEVIPEDWSIRLSVPERVEPVVPGEATETAA